MAVWTHAVTRNRGRDRPSSANYYPARKTRVCKTVAGLERLAAVLRRRSAGFASPLERWAPSYAGPYDQGAARVKIHLRAGGAKAPEDMPGGEYMVRCDRGEIKVRGKSVQVVLSFTVEGRVKGSEVKRDFAGVALKQWYTIAQVTDDRDDALDVSPHSKYATACGLALNRQITPKDNFDPKLFENKVFRVDVGFRSNSGGTFSYKNLGSKKDPRDFLRVHSILEKVEEKGATHMRSLTPYEYTDNVHEHEHVARASAPAPSPQLYPSRILHFVKNSHMNDEQSSEGHHEDPEAGQPTQDSPEPPNSDDFADDWDEAAILRTKGPETLEKVAIVKKVFPGSRVIQ